MSEDKEVLDIRSIMAVMESNYTDTQLIMLALATIVPHDEAVEVDALRLELTRRSAS